jgi:hypothetical protein
MIVLVIVSQAKFYVARENPKKRISLQETVIHPKLWSFLRWLSVSFETAMTAASRAHVSQMAPVPSAKLACSVPRA